MYGGSGNRRSGGGGRGGGGGPARGGGLLGRSPNLGAGKMQGLSNRGRGGAGRTPGGQYGTPGNAARNAGRTPGSQGQGAGRTPGGRGPRRSGGGSAGGTPARGRGGALMRTPGSGGGGPRMSTGSNGRRASGGRRSLDDPMDRSYLYDEPDMMSLDVGGGGMGNSGPVDIGGIMNLITMQQQQQQQHHQMGLGSDLGPSLMGIPQRQALLSDIGMSPRDGYMGPPRFGDSPMVRPSPQGFHRPMGGFEGGNSRSLLGEPGRRMGGGLMGDGPNQGRRVSGGGAIKRPYQQEPMRRYGDRQPRPLGRLAQQRRGDAQGTPQDKRRRMTSSGGTPGSAGDRGGKVTPAGGRSGDRARVPSLNAEKMRHCNVCNYTCDQKAFERHISGANHKTKLEESRVLLKGVKYCRLCNVRYPEKENETHLKSVRHLEKRRKSTPYCIYCTTRFKSAVTFLEHCKSEEHKKKKVEVEAEAKAKSEEEAAKKAEKETASKEAAAAAAAKKAADDEAGVTEEQMEGLVTVDTIGSFEDEEGGDNTGEGDATKDGETEKKVEEGDEDGAGRQEQGNDGEDVPAEGDGDTTGKEEGGDAADKAAGSSPMTATTGRARGRKRTAEEADQSTDGGEDGKPAEEGKAGPSGDADGTGNADAAGKSEKDGADDTKAKEDAVSGDKKEDEEEKTDDGKLVVKPDTAYGVEYIVAATGFFCRLCHKFYNNEVLAKGTHCKSEGHIANYEKIAFKPGKGGKGKLSQDSITPIQAPGLKKFQVSRADTGNVKTGTRRGGKPSTYLEREQKRAAAAEAKRKAAALDLETAEAAKKKEIEAAMAEDEALAKEMEGLDEETLAMVNGTLDAYQGKGRGNKPIFGGMRKKLY